MFKSGAAKGVLSIRGRRGFWILLALIGFAACSSHSAGSAAISSGSSLPATLPSVTANSGAPASITMPPAPTSTLAPVATTSLPAASTTVAPAPPTSPVKATAIAYVAPVDMVGRPLPGIKVVASSVNCDEPGGGSDSVGNVEVYRCGPGLDPCWYDAAGGILCMQTPWDTSALHPVSTNVAFGVDVAPTDLDNPWGVQLTSGQRCIGAQGAHDVFRSRVVDYDCTGGPIKGLELLRGVNRSAPLWTYQTTIWNGTTEVAGPVVAVATAWFAGPAPPQTPAPTCTPTAIEVTVAFDPQVPMEAGIDFENASPAECRLSGYPTVTVLDSAGRPLFQVGRSSQEVATDITIPPKGSAGAGLDGNPDYPHGSCPSYTRLRVTVPGTTTSTIVSTGPLTICPHAQIGPIDLGN